MQRTLCVNFPISDFPSYVFLADEPPAHLTIEKKTRTEPFGLVITLGKKDQAPYADYLDCVRAAFAIAVMWSGGQRANGDYEKMTINDFFVCNSGRVLWCVENESHKQTG